MVTSLRKKILGKKCWHGTLLLVLINVIKSFQLFTNTFKGFREYNGALFPIYLISKHSNPFRVKQSSCEIVCIKLLPKRCS